MTPEDRGRLLVGGFVLFILMCIFFGISSHTTWNP